MTKRERLHRLSGFFRGFGVAAILGGIGFGVYWQADLPMLPSGFHVGFTLVVGLLCIWMGEREIVA